MAYIVYTALLHLCDRDEEEVENLPLLCADLSNAPMGGLPILAKQAPSMPLAL